MACLSLDLAFLSASCDRHSLSTSPRLRDSVMNKKPRVCLSQELSVSPPRAVEESQAEWVILNREEESWHREGLRVTRGQREW